MADIKTREARSYNMSKIKGSNTGPEVYLGKKLFARGFRYRKNSSAVIGHPDLWLRKYKAAIFVNGCFWHRHLGCKYAYTPKSRVDFWTRKFANNVQRDIRVQNELLANGVKCIIVWECTIKKMQKSDSYEDEIINQICCFLKSGNGRLEI